MPIGTLPTSNVAGNNQMSPGAGPKPISVPASGGMGSVQNPYFTPPTVGTGALPAGAAPPTSSSGIFNTQQMTDTTKQFEDIFGKGTGGGLASVLGGMSGENSQIFQQFLASMRPEQAAQRASLQQTLGSTGVSGNSSVSAIANADLTAQFAGQEAKVNAGLMEHGLDQSINILQSTQQDAAAQVAQSGWTVFGDVMSNITADVGNLMHGGGVPTSHGPGAMPMNVGTPTLPFGQDTTMGMPIDTSGLGSAPDLSMFAG